MEQPKPLYDVCFGTNCLLKKSCFRYREVIDVHNERHLATVPYKVATNTCSFLMSNPFSEYETAKRELLKHKNG